MFICPAKRFGFIHIPKTGGTTLCRNLLYPLGCTRVGHKHGPVGDLPFDCAGYYLFAMVRNPYERLASHYRFRKIRDRQHGDFAERYPSLSSLLDSNIHKWGGKDGKFPLSQMDYIDERVEVFRFEEFNAAVESLTERFCLEAQTKLACDESTNYFGRYHWQSEFDERAVDIINEFCAADFKHFKYTKLTWKDIRNG